MAKVSPFPGMDPWLESHWEPVHHRCIEALCDQINEQLPDDLFVDVEITVYVLDSQDQRSLVRPDGAVFDLERPADASGGYSIKNRAVATPVLIPTFSEPVRQGTAVIRSLETGHPLVTAIEIFSPSNKFRREGRHTYRQKRRRYRRAGANVVEIDLLRGGRSLVDVQVQFVLPVHRAAYRAVVCRAGGSTVEYYPLRLRERLPTIRVPLRPADPDVFIDLQTPIDGAYRKGRFGNRLDYSKPPDPPLSPEDAEWAAERIAAGRDPAGSVESR
jgi:hypothetical protein